jgi:hypothetical protein
MKPSESRVMLAILGGLATIFALGAAFVILNTLLLVPDNPHLSSMQNLQQKAKIIGGFALPMALFAALGNWCFTKWKALRKQ